MRLMGQYFFGLTHAPDADRGHPRATSRAASGTRRSPRSATSGTGIGAAISGLRPIVDVATASFIFQAFSQVVNEAANIHYMTGGQTRVPDGHPRQPRHPRRRRGAALAQPAGDALEHAGPADHDAVVARATCAACFATAVAVRRPGLLGRPRASCSTSTGRCPDAPEAIPFGVADIKRRGTRRDDRGDLVHGPALARARPRSSRREGICGRGRRPAHARAARPRDDPRLGGADGPARRRRRVPPQLRGRRGDRGARRGARLRRAARPDPARRDARRAHPVQPAAGGVRRAHRSRGSWTAARSRPTERTAWPGSPSQLPAARLRAGHGTAQRLAQADRRRNRARRGDRRDRDREGDRRAARRSTAGRSSRSFATPGMSSRWAK